MDLTAFALRADLEGTVEITNADGQTEEVPKFTGAVLAVGDGDLHVRDELERGGGVIVCQENDQVLIDLLDAYPALKRTSVPEKPAAVIDPYERRTTETLRHLLSLRDLSGHGGSRQAAIRALNAHDRALRAGEPELAQRIEAGAEAAVAEALGEEGQAGDGLERLNKEDLTALAGRNDVSLEGATTKPEIVDRLRAAGVRKEA